MTAIAFPAGFRIGCWQDPADDGRGDKYKGEVKMSWRKPSVKRIAIGCEINAYACAVV
jgi:coenzyme PQQ precursor peptide PqqA